jgi:hypothetical protein
MAPGETETIAKLLEALTGQRAPLPEGQDGISSFPKSGLGYSQLNELLLLFGYDRVTRPFFQFLADGTLDYKPGCAIRSIEEFQTGVERARQLSLLFFGNVKFGFKKFGRDADELRFYHASTQPVDEEMFKNRHDPIHPVDPIPLDETYYLGYLIQKEINDQLAKSPNDDAALAARKVQERVVEKGIHNQHAYLVSDHLDVYVATSMRRKHEYVEVAQFANQLFKHDLIRELKLRWFDPTQAYCADRIDKGLAEALMLKRAKCTLYLAQESDTLGKDSELASTLAQGKPVIAYVPSPTEKDVVESVTTLSVLYGKSESLVILERLQAFSPNLAWENPQVRQWLDVPDKVDTKEALELLVKTAQGHYARRAEMLRESHPLGIQVNLDTGVANGVLVVRTLEDCAKLIRRIVTTTLQFSIDKKSIGDVEYHLLRENVSKSIFRVMTGDAMLSNSFWNFYLEPSD